MTLWLAVYLTVALWADRGGSLPDVDELEWHSSGARWTAHGRELADGSEFEWVGKHTTWYAWADRELVGSVRLSDPASRPRVTEAAA